MAHKHICSGLVVTCIDFRFQKIIEDWMQIYMGEGKYDRVAWAGGIFDSVGVIKQVDISVRLHDIKKLILMNHEDCGAYGKSGTHARHCADLKEVKKKIAQLHPQLKVETYFIHLDGVFEKIE